LGILWDFHKFLSKLYGGSMILLRDFYWIPVGFPWYFYDISMGLIWDFYGLATMGSYGLSKGCLCNFNWIPMGFLWDFFGLSMIFLVDVYGISMGLLRDLYWIPL
jgi:hypothetical protein